MRQESKKDAVHRGPGEIYSTVQALLLKKQNSSSWDFDESLACPETNIDGESQKEGMSDCKSRA